MHRLVFFSLFLMSAGFAPAGVLLNESFNDIATLPSSGWALQNNSSPLGTTNWFQGNAGVFSAQSGAADSYIAANFLNADAGGNIGNWLITPVLSLVDGASIHFHTRASGVFEDSLEVRLNTAGTVNVGATDTSVGDFTTLLLSVNPFLDGSYPTAWTQFSVSITGVPIATNSRIGFRYVVPDTNTNGDYIGIDTLQVNDVPEPTTLCLLGLGMAAIAIVRRRKLSN